MRVAGGVGAQGLQDQQLLGRVGQVVLAAHHVGDPGVEVIDGDGEVVERRAVGAGDDRIVEVGVREAGLAADHVVDERLAVVGNA